MKVLYAVLCVCLHAHMYSQTYDFSLVDKILQDSLQNIAGIGGGCALVLMKDGKEIYSKSFSLPGKSYTVNKIVPIASSSKWLACGVVMGLLQDGIWTLEDSAGKYLPYIDGDKARMTIRQLFSMTSGIKEDGNGLEDSILRNNDISLDSAVKQILALPLATKPGGSMAYGGRGMHIAGRCAEIASGIPLETGQAWNSLFSKYVSTPLGLKVTQYLPGKNPGIAGSVASNAKEYSVYLQMMINNGKHADKQIISKEIISEMKKDQTFGAPIMYSPFALWKILNPSLDLDGKARYALGHWREIVDYSNDEVLESSSLGAFGFAPWIDWKRNLTGVFSVWSEGRVTVPTYITLKKAIRNSIDGISSIQNDSESTMMVQMNNTVIFSEKVQSFTVYSLSGTVVQQSQSMEEWDYTGLSNGLYMIDLVSKDQQHHIQKLTIIH